MHHVVPMRHDWPYEGFASQKSLAIGLSKLHYIKNTDSYKSVRSGTFCNIAMYTEVICIPASGFV